MGRELGKVFRIGLQREIKKRKRKLREKDPFLDLLYRKTLLPLSEYHKLSVKVQRKLDLEILLDHLQNQLEGYEGCSPQYTQLLCDLKYLHSFYDSFF
ncbi:MAG: hypothetical protein ACOCQB_00180 [Halanaerobiaceae bacterium]